MKRQSTLELFILSCVDRGIATPYDLQRLAGLSLGATNPALKRLVKSGLLKRTAGKSATRRPRHDYTLTDQGKKVARTGWKDYLEGPAALTDIDSLLRIIDLAGFYKAPKTAIVIFLEHSIAQRANALELLILAERQRRPESQSPQYLGLRAEFELVRYRAEFQMLNNILSRFTTKPPKRIPVGVGQRLLIPPTE